MTDLSHFNQGVMLIGPLDHIYVSWCHSSLEKWSLGCHQNNHPSPFSSVKLLLSVTFSGRWVMSFSLSLFLLCNLLKASLLCYERLCESHSSYLPHVMNVAPYFHSKVKDDPFFSSHKIKKKSWLSRLCDQSLSCFLSFFQKKHLLVDVGRCEKCF